MKRFELSVGRRYNETESIDKKPNRREGLRSGFSWHRPSADESQTKKKQTKKQKQKRKKKKKTESKPIPPSPSSLWKTKENGR